MFKKTQFKILDVTPQKIWPLDVVKNYLRISHNYDDDLLSNLIEASIASAENFIRRELKVKRIEFISNTHKYSTIGLRHKPILEIIKIISKEKEQETLLTKEQYHVDLEQGILQLDKNYNTSELIIEFIAGYKEENIPASTKHGILLHVAGMYDREVQEGGMFPVEVKNLYLPHRGIRI